MRSPSLINNAAVAVVLELPHPRRIVDRLGLAKTLLRTRGELIALGRSSWPFRSTLLDGGKKVVVGEWLSQESNRAALHRLGMQAIGAIVTRYEDRWNRDSLCRELSLQLETVHSRQPDVNDETTGMVRGIRAQNLVVAGESLRLVASGAQKLLMRLPNGVMVVDHTEEAFP